MSASPIEITVFSKDGGPLTKRISLGPDGKVASDGSACTMARGRARRARIAGVDDLAALIGSLESNQAIALGALRSDLPDEVAIVTKAKLNGAKGGVIARTAENFVFEPGRPAYVLLDHDAKGMPSSVAEKLESAGFWEALVEVCPGLTASARLLRRSTSAGLRRKDTGEEFAGSGGLHVYLQISDGSDARRFLEALHDRCWLAGLGWIALSKVGSYRDMSIVDLSVGSPERLVFEGAPILEPPLEQDRDLRRPITTHGKTIDTRAACPPLTASEIAELKRLKDDAKQALTAKRAELIGERARAMAQERGISVDAARQIVENQCNGVLFSSHALEFDNIELAGKTVKDVLDDPAAFENQTLADPLDGAVEGRCKAKVMIGRDGVPFINSFARHGVRYQLRYDDAEPKPRAHAEPATAPVDLWNKFKPPSLPTGLLPTVIERFALEQGALMGADPGGLAGAAIAACSAAVPDFIKLRVKRHSGWMESTRAWIGLVGDPSAKKTPTINRATRQITRIDAAMWRAYLAAKAHWDALTKDEKKTSAPPRQTRLKLEDTTIEAAQEVMRDSPNGVLCLRDELSGWFGTMDKYAGHRGAAMDRAFWLQAYDGNSYAYNRVGRGAGMIENLSASVLGGIQPEPMRKLVEGSVDDGLIQRIMPIMVQRGSVGSDEPDSPAAAAYDDLIVRLHGMKQPFDEIQFEEPAREIRQELERRHNDLIACEALHKKLASHIGKYDGIFARLCLLWHCVESTDKEPEPRVTADTARRVADFLHTFLLPHALAFYTDVLGASEDHDHLAAVAGYILAHKVEVLTNRIVQRGDRTMRRFDQREIERVCQQLDALGWLDRISGLRGTDPPRWYVNPEVHRLFADRAREEEERRRREREMIAVMFRSKEP